MRSILFAIPMTLVLLGGSLCADVVQLAGGGKVTGRALKDSSRTTLSIALEGGGRLTIDRGQIAGFSSESDAMVEYRKRAPTAPDTIESQWALAKWCQERRLGDEYRRHLERVVQLDPQHQEARRLLGYQQQGGRWLTRDQVMQARGMIRYEGQYRTRQEVALLERAKVGKERGADWRNQLERWRRNLNSRDRGRAGEAAQGFQNLNQRAAGPALAALLLKEGDPAVKQMLIDVAGRLRSGATVGALTKIALEDDNEEFRFTSLEHLARAKTPGLSEPFVRSLRSKDNALVNRAATALEELEAKEAIGPLVDALVTTHRFRVGEDTGNGQRYNVGFSGNGAFSFGGGGAKSVPQDIKNPQVLSALVQLTGENFGYNEDRWREWLAARETDSPIDLRRDE